MSRVDQNSSSKASERSTRRNQRDRILQLLIAARGNWIPSPELAAISLQYSARISEARKLGFQIENKVEHHDGNVFGFFRLVLGAKPAQGTLFDLTSSRHKDLG
jgi:hypothetical protein